MEQMTMVANKVITVLVVDGSEVIRNKIKELLSELENVSIVAEADSARSAIKMGLIHKPDVMILDVRLAGREDGFTVLKQVKTIHPETITILLSDGYDIFYKGKLRELGVDYFFDKSNEFESMLKVFSWI